MRFLIHRKVLISMLFLSITMLGYFSYKRLQVELFPSTELPVLFVMVNSRIEMEPAYMEKQAIIPLEGSIGTLENIEKIESLAGRRQGHILISYDRQVDTKYAYLKLEEKINQVKDEIPEEFNISISRINTDMASYQFMTLQAIGGGGVNRIRNLVEDEISPKLQSIDGIADITISGGRQHSVEVQLNDEACKAHGITLAQIRNSIRNNHLDKTFVGRIKDNDKRYFVNVVSEYDHLSDIEEIIVKQDNAVRLKEIADVYYGLKEQETISRINGKDAVTLTLIRDTQVNLIDLSHNVQQVIGQLNKSLANQDLELFIQHNAAATMEKNINMLIRLALVGGLLAVIVLWIFLRNLRLVSIIALAIPVSIYAAFNLFYAFGITINQFTMVGMVLAVGMLLDNSIVVLENIYRLKAEGANASVAVIRGTREVMRAIIAATLTTITVFLPFVFTGNFFIKLIGEHIGISIISTLSVSLFVALLLIPMLTHAILSRTGQKSLAYFQHASVRNYLINRYLVLLRACMRQPVKTIAWAFVIFFISIFICLALSFTRQRQPDVRDFDIYLTMSSGSTLENTDKVVAEIEAKLEDLEEKESITSRIREEEATVTVGLKEDYTRINDRSLGEIKQDVLGEIRNIANASISFEQTTASGGRGRGGDRSQRQFMRLLGMGSSENKILVKGEDFDVMKSVAQNVEEILEDLETVSNANVSVNENRPEAHLYFDPRIIARYNVSLNNIRSELLTFQREVASDEVYKRGFDEYDIVITRTQHKPREEEEEKTLADLQSLQVENDSGANWELQQFSNIYLSRGLGEINRVNQEKQIEVYYSFYNEINDSKSASEEARLEMEEILGTLTLPSGIAIEVVREEEAFENFKPLIFAAIILIFMILASIFESVTTPFVLLVSVPLAFMGSFIALIVTGHSLLDANTITGLIILLGIVVNNGILLIDYSNILVAGGYSQTRALITSGMSRVRPIFISAITTIIAMFPLAMGRTEYVEMIGAPFAITVIGGLTLSTLFTLILIPTFYSGLNRGLSWYGGLPLPLILTNVILYVVLVLLIVTGVEKLIFQILFIVLSAGLIPGITYFVMHSLRRASSSILGDAESIQISIRNLVKVYDRPTRFSREWRRGHTLLRANENRELTSWQKLDQLVWQLPMLGFLVYFVYFYLDSGFFMFTGSLMLYFYLFYILAPLRRDFTGKRFQGIISRMHQLFFWGFPALNLTLLQLKWRSLALVIVLAALWYLAILIYATSGKLFREKTNIQRLTGRFRKIRYAFYNLVLGIPLIGKNVVPFKALKGVSMEIGTGMYGLLGPNGAGKSTMMRIICGILEQSYGKIWINGIDTQRKREELQALIGYLPQEFGMYENMTAFHYLNYMAILKDIPDKEEREARVQYVLEEVNMADHQREKIASFSGGMKQRIGIAQILLHLPRILVVDEPTAGLDPRERIRFRNLLIELSKNRIVLFSTHIIEDISTSCKKVAVLNKGELKYFGEPKHMTDTARGYVWQFHVPAAELEQLYHKYLIVSHMREGDAIRVRCIAREKPHADAVNSAPQMEDAYLWLQRQ